MRGAHKTVRRVRFQIRPGGARFKLVVRKRLGKSRTTINAGTFPGPSSTSTTPPRKPKKKTSTGLSFTVRFVHCAVNFCVFWGFSSCRHHRSRLQYGKTLQLLASERKLQRSAVRTSVRPTTPPPPIRPSGRSLDYHSRNLPAGRGRASARRPRVPNNQSNSNPIQSIRQGPRGGHWLGGRTGIQLWGWQIGGVSIKFFFRLVRPYQGPGRTSCRAANWQSGTV